MPPQNTQNQQPNQPPFAGYPTRPNVTPGQPIPKMPKKPHSWALIIPLVLFILLFIAASSFGFWAYAERNDYKDNVDQKVAAAVEQAVQEAEAAKEEEFLEREKRPYRQYRGPGAFGAIVIQYPKTWSAFVSETSGREPVDGYFHPGFVPDQKSGVGFALRLEVIEQPYDQILGDYESEAEKGEVTISPYSPPKVPSVLGVRINGMVEKDHQGSTVLFPLRDKTIRLTTLSPQFVGDFNNHILPNFEFTP